MLLYSYNRFISVIFLDIHLLKVGNREHCVDVIVICIIMCYCKYVHTLIHLPCYLVDLV